MKENYMGKTMPDCSLWCNYSITFTPKYPFFSSDCILKFGPLHLLLSITSKRIKLQMWDCAQTKALEKNFNLVTDKSWLKWKWFFLSCHTEACMFTYPNPHLYRFFHQMGCLYWAWLPERSVAFQILWKSTVDRNRSLWVQISYFAHFSCRTY